MDASLKDVGAVLLRDNKPFDFASKAVTDVETRYVNIERELLAMVYGSLTLTCLVTVSRSIVVSRGCY